MKTLRQICDEAPLEPRNGYDGIWEEDERFYIIARKALPAAIDLIEKMKGALETCEYLYDDQYWHDDGLVDAALAAVKEFEGEG